MGKPSKTKKNKVQKLTEAEYMAYLASLKGTFENEQVEKTAVGSETTKENQTQ